MFFLLPLGEGGEGPFPRNVGNCAGLVPSPQRYALGLRPPLPEGEGTNQRQMLETPGTGEM